MHQYIDVWVSNTEPAASSVVVRNKCIKLYISATLQPIQMNEHSFCTIWNVPDGSIVINAIMCKVMTLLFHMHINTRLYIFRNKRTYCYILFSKPQQNTPIKHLLTPTDSHENYLSILIPKCIIIQIWRSHMHQYIDVWVSNTDPAAFSVVVRYKCIKLHISATLQPIQMNEHSFCTIWNVPDGSIVINAIMCKVMTLLFQVHINTRLYIFRNKRTYCYILFSKSQHNTPSKFLLTPKISHENYLSIQILKCMIIQIWRSHMHQYIDVWVSNTEPAAFSVVVRYKCIKLYISATLQPIEMYEHSFCAIWNVPDGSIVINAIMCKVMTLLFQVHINTRLYTFRNKRIYCYLLLSKPQHNTPFKLLLTPTDQQIAMKIIYLYIPQNVWSFKFEGPICTNI